MIFYINDALGNHANGASFASLIEGDIKMALKFGNKSFQVAKIDNVVVIQTEAGDSVSMPIGPVMTVVNKIILNYLGAGCARLI